MQKNYNIFYIITLCILILFIHEIKNENNFIKTEHIENIDDINKKIKINFTEHFDKRKLYTEFEQDNMSIQENLIDSLKNVGPFNVVSNQNYYEKITNILN